MLKIRPGQYEALARYALEQYAQRTLAQFKEHFSTHCQIIGDEPMRKMILLGVERAKQHDIHGECNVVLYTSLMLLFGSYFDEDPQYPWAAQILSNESLSLEGERAERLYDRGVEAWESMAGQDNIEMVQAIARTRDLSFDDLAGRPAESLPELFRQVHWQKVMNLGQNVIDAVIHVGVRLAKEHALEPRASQNVLSMVAFFLGTGFAKDPLYPWAARTLAAPDLAAADKVVALHRHATQYAAAWLAHAESRAT